MLSNVILNISHEANKISRFNEVQGFLVYCQAIPVAGLAASAVLAVVGVAQTISGVVLGFIFFGLSFLSTGKSFKAEMERMSLRSFKVADIGLKSLAFGAVNLATLGAAGIVGGVIFLITARPALG